MIEQVETATKYAGYIDKQSEEVARALHFEDLPLPADLDYGQVTALSFEVRQKLAATGPRRLGLASRISGVTPAAISLLLVHLKKKRLELRKAAAPSPAELSARPDRRRRRVAAMDLSGDPRSAASRRLQALALRCKGPESTGCWAIWTCCTSGTRPTT